MPDAERIARIRNWALTDGQHFGYRDMARRTALVREALAATDPALLLTERWGVAQAAMLREIAVQIAPDDLLAGHFCPEVPGAWEAAGTAALDTLGIPPALPDPQLAAFRESWRQAHAQQVWSGSVGEGHHNVDFAAVLTRGLAALAAEAEQAAAEHIEAERAAAARGMAWALRGAIAFAQRHAEEAERQAITADPVRATELRRIAAACRRVPAHPAASFFEAVQAVWLTYLLVGMTESPSANSLGALDRLLWPYYQCEIAAGTLTANGAEELLAHFLLKCGSYSEGQALTLGGQHADGTDAVNDLTRCFLRVILALRMPEPIIAVRWHEAMRAEDLELAAQISAAGLGQPSYYAEPCCRAMLVARGVPAAEIERLSINSCMGVVVSGAELDDMWAIILLLPAALEVAISGGCAADGTPLPVFVPLCREEYHSFDALFDAYARVSASVIAHYAANYRQETDYLARWFPNPLLSGLLDDCRTRGLDRFAGGPRYTSAIVEGFGWANVADALTAIEELVFRQCAVTLPELLTAARADYAGEAALLRRVRACPKYGNDHPTADAMARRVLDAFIAAVNAQNGSDHRAFRASLHTLNHHVYMGACVPAGLDGRPFGAPFNKQLGPSVWAAQSGPTAVLTSAARMPAEHLPGGQALDISLPPGLLDHAAGRTQFQALLRTYFSLGGADLQVNTVDPATLRAAQADPSAFPQLIVRVAGYSEFFQKLPRTTQDDLILRLEAGV